MVIRKAGHSLLQTVSGLTGFHVDGHPIFSQPITNQVLQRVERFSFLDASQIYLLVIRSTGNSHRISRGVPYQALVQPAQAIVLAREMGIPFDQIEYLIAMRIAPMNPLLARMVCPDQVRMQAARHYAVAKRMERELLKGGATAVPTISFDTGCMGNPTFDSTFQRIAKRYSMYGAFQTAFMAVSLKKRRQGNPSAILLKLGATRYKSLEELKKKTGTTALEKGGDESRTCEAAFDLLLEEIPEIAKGIGSLYSDYPFLPDLDSPISRVSPYQVNDEPRVLLHGPRSYGMLIQTIYRNFNRRREEDRSYARRKRWVGRIESILRDIRVIQRAFPLVFSADTLAPLEFTALGRKKAKLEPEAEASESARQKLRDEVYPDYYDLVAETVRQSLVEIGIAFFVSPKEIKEAYDPRNHIVPGIDF